MAIKKRSCLLLCIIICFFSIGLQVPTHKAHAFSSQIIQRGAVGDDVIELQARLQYIGFYHGKIDGVFGWSTYWALRNFQEKYGMEIDGLAGAKAKQKLVKASKYDEKYVKDQINKGNTFTYYGGVDLKKKTKPAQNNQNTAPSKNTNTGNNANTTTTAVNVPKGYSQNDVKLLANAVHGEARGEPYEGQVAVAAVILNRVKSATFPNTVAGVIFEPRAFTAVSDGQIWLTPNETSKKAVLDAINGWDPTGNALYYFNPETATSSWIWSRPQIKQIGKHIFCK
ncbi:spore cortex-lytic enzyme [Paracerasibacillus soli]|uniref:Spore cortex-lytic enzyme n=1 Tax=Paracerasibacillus soli TaxID=480284 RepID=A0ABU5CPP4_9BACI|nr:spore cortex-lytic enzyme [Virgibacillus soli]MDY0408330.1 spore cortex-lytic enzyme [Virgibacillus soli]